MYELPLMSRARIFFFTVLLLLSYLNVSAQEYINKDEFFSYERFSLDQNALDKIPPTGRTQTDLNNFAENFTRGLNAAAEGRTAEAEKYLLEAREYWPEYFNTDFLLARVYEDSGDSKKSARFYKSYLLKLRRFHAGDYRISEPLIRVFVSSGIEEFGPANKAVEERLSGYGISLGRVRPVITPPLFVIPLILAAAAVFIFLMITRKLVPYLKMAYRMKHPPEGYWMCQNCGTGNTELNKVCEKCGKPHEG
jgi:tetratricopeptide (TPR) repeat protein